MRTWTLLLVGAAALVGSTGAIAAPVNGSVIKEVAEQIGIGESVHCRPFRHQHRWGYGRGCGGATIYYDTGPRYRYGYRYGHRDGYGRSGMDVRTRSGTTFRSEGRTVRSGERGDFRGGATIRSGPAGEVSPRSSAGGQAGGAAVTGGGGGMGGGQMQSAPAGSGGGAAAVGSGGGGGGRAQGGGSGRGGNNQ